LPKITQSMFTMQPQPGKRLLMGRHRMKRNARIKARAGFMCAACGAVTYPENLEVDHIKPLFRGGTDTESNLQALCVACHADKSASEISKSVRIGVDGWPV